MDLTIFYYTNNLLSRRLLVNTLKEAIQHATRNDCQLIITSHYPVMEKYDVIDFGDNNPISTSNENHLIRDLRLTSQQNIRNYVCNFPSGINSIMRQIIFSCESCKTSKVVLMEHDCFYPENYCRYASAALDDVDVTYCIENYIMLYKEGFVTCDHAQCLSSFSFKTKTLERLFKNKLEIYKRSGGKYTTLEPSVKLEYVYEKMISKDGVKRNIIKPKTKRSQHLPPSPISPFDIMYLTEWEKQDLGDFTSKCIDEILGDNNCVLEIEHGLNTSFNLNLMRKVANLTENKENCYVCSFLSHPYWGDANKFIKMISGD